MRVLLADDHTQVRWALRTVIKEEPGLVVVGEVSRPEDLLLQALCLQPDLILLEWELSGSLTGTFLAGLRSHGVKSQVIVLSHSSVFREAALASGADAFVSKAGPPEQLVDVLHRMARR
jgi:DNA-binding NarL/FixJ family response regulator